MKRQGGFPWYDSVWLNSYVRAKRHIRQNWPQKLPEFLGALEVLRTDPAFQTRSLTNLFDAGRRDEMRSFVSGLMKPEFENHELFQFGRRVVHDHDFFNALQDSIVDRISEVVNEAVEPSYNF